MGKLFILTASVTVFLTGCVKVQLLPEDAVKNSWKAGKELLDETQLKRSGGEKRQYANQVVVDQYPSRHEAERQCAASLREKLYRESTSKQAVITAERINVVDGLKNNKIECQVVGFVWR